MSTLILKTKRVPLDFIKYLKEKLYCDFKFMCKDGEIKEAHKVILAAHSEPLAKAFQNSKESQPVIYVPHDQEVLDNLLSLVYKGEVNVSEDLSKKVLELAKLFEINCTQEEEENFILNNVVFNCDGDLSRTPSDLDVSRRECSENESNDNVVNTSRQITENATSTSRNQFREILHSPNRENSSLNIRLTEESDPLVRNTSEPKTSTPEKCQKRTSTDNELLDASPRRKSKTVVINPICLKRLKGNARTATQDSMEPQVGSPQQIPDVSNSSRSSSSPECVKKFLEMPLAKLRDIYCLVCGEFMEDRDEFMQHKKQHQTRKKFKCKYCFRVFYMVVHLQYHLKICEQKDG